METRIKERLVGAIALVAIVVIVVPELLTGPRAPPPPRGAPAAAPVHTVSNDLAATERGTIARAPAQDGAPAAAAAAGAAAEAPPPAVAAPPAAPSPAAPAEAVAHGSGTPSAAPATPAPEAPAAAVPTTAPASAGAPRPAVPAAAAEGWVVQLGSFASRDNAEAFAKGLRGKGYRAFVSEFHGSGRVLYRVRVGPEQDRARAEAIGARLAREGHRGSIVPQP